MADGRLEEAAYAGDVALFRRLLEEDRLLLQRQATVAASSISDAPLHIAASLGHLEFVREILAIHPHLARRRNGDGLSALHLASANGHLDVVKELLSQAAAPTELCLLLDNNGFMPVHTAAAQGRVEVLRELLDAPLEYPKTRALTSHGESILHLSVKSNSYETLQYLLERDDVDDELLNLKDEKGNTVLHLAVARRQFQMVELLLAQQLIQVNAMNLRNCTALNVLLDSPCQHGDLRLVELLMKAGGTTASVEGIGAEPSIPPGNGVGVARSIKRKECSPFKNEKYNNKPGTLMVVATLIATITFQAALNPPDGFKQEYDIPDYVRCFNGVVPCSKLSKLQVFLIFDIIGLFASLSIILLLICCVPRKKTLVMGLLKWVLWLAVFSTALAFTAAVREMFDRSFAADLTVYWFLMFPSFFMAWVSFRVMRSLLRRYGCWKKKNNGGQDPKKVAAVISKIVVGVLTVMFFGIFGIFSIAVYGFVQ